MDISTLNKWRKGEVANINKFSVIILLNIITLVMYFMIVREALRRKQLNIQNLISLENFGKK